MIGHKQNALKYLPQETPIDVHIVITIDGFNAGMFRDNYTFLSLAHIDASKIRPELFTHEIHHVGVKYWWKRHPIVQKYASFEDTIEYWLLRIFWYVVSEGLANAFCSPGMIEKTEKKSDAADRHNAIIDGYEENYEEIFSRLENLVSDILEGLDNTRDPFDELTLDMKNAALPQGHFLAGKMIQAMNRSPQATLNQIINLAKETIQILPFLQHSCKRPWSPIILR